MEKEPEKETEGAASEIGREIREQYSGGREVSCSIEDRVENCVKPSEEPRPFLILLSSFLTLRSSFLILLVQKGAFII